MFVGIFKGLTRFGRRRAPDESASEGLSVLLHGRDAFTLDVAGCTRRQPAIREIMAIRADSTGRRKCVASLDPDRSGIGGPNVGVVIDGTLVGYFPRHLSTQYCEWLDAWNLSRAQVHCQALIVGDGGKVQPTAADYRVKLDIEIPFKMTAIHT